ncbi:hypothetical protein RCL1_009035 [Eukaryota sp. TZLM3-RCL]
MYQTLHLSRSCLAHSIGFLLRSGHDARPSYLVSIFHNLSVFGNVSSRFRTLVLDTILLYLTETTPFFCIPTNLSQLTFLHHLFPQYHFSITSTSEFFHLFSKLPIKAVEFDQDDDDTSDQTILQELNSIDINKIQVLKIPFSDLIANHLSTFNPKLLNSMTFFFGSYHSEQVKLPCFPYLKQLSLEYFHIPYRIALFDVSNMSHLSSLSISCSHGSVHGLSQLRNLQELELVGVTDCDCLHSSARLYDVKLTVCHSVLNKLFVDPLNYGTCRLSLLYCQEFPGLSVIKQTATLSHRFKNEFLALNLSDTNYPVVEDLDFVFSGNITINLGKLLHLKTLSLSVFHTFMLTTNCSSVLYISVLKLCSITVDSFYNLLKHCPYLQHLELNSVNCPDKSQIVSDLPFLKSLKLTFSSSIFSCIGLLHSLKRLQINSIADFDLTNLNINFPKLLSLEVTDSPLNGTLTGRNFSIKFLKIKCTVHNFSVENSDFLSSFSRLDTFSFDVPPHLLSSRFILPNSIRFLYYKSCFHFFQELWNNSTKEFTVSGQLFVDSRSMRRSSIWTSRLVRENSSLHHNIDLSPLR